MNYTETLQYFADFPPFSPAKVVAGEEVLNLNSIQVLLDRLGNPEKSLSFVHITGTNGKGSTATYLRNILMQSGYRTGQFSSPYLLRFTEQITVDGEEIGQDAVAEITTEVRKVADQMDAEGLQAPSAFEVTVAVALVYYKKQQCDVVVLEVGLGGKSDATNVIPAPLLAIITSISLDHTEILGDTLEKIAQEKGGIIKSGCEVLLYPQSEEVTGVIREICRENDVTLTIGATATPQDIQVEFKGGDRLPMEQYFSLRPSSECQSQRREQFADNTEPQPVVYHTKMLASYQCQNATMAICAARILRDKQLSKITEASIADGIAAATWPARFEIMQRNPYIIVDGSHNTEGAQMLRKNLDRYFRDCEITFIVGVLEDKSYGPMMRALMPIAKRFYTVTPDSERALPADALAAFLNAECAEYPIAQATSGIEEAISLAKDSCSGRESDKNRKIDGAVLSPDNNSADKNVICIFGSLYYAGQAREILLRE